MLQGSAKPASRFGRFRSLRTRLLGVIIVSLVLPVAGAVYYLNKSLEARLDAARELAQDITGDGVRRQEDLIREARNLLSVLSLVPTLRHPDRVDDEACVGILGSLPKN
ncbi:MAG TPA: hybrid sensor histidine kinase/response regulator, partial [Azospirillaceae bacterium]|nr:hybrid sensor histidine kinase/response regulator [Azospirillaceae bacterium]